METPLSLPPGTMREPFQEKIRTSGIMNHGVISALLLEKLAERLHAEGKWQHGELELVKGAAPAAACHDIDLKASGNRPPKSARSLSRVNPSPTF